MVEFVPDLSGGGDGAVADPGGFGFAGGGGLGVGGGGGCGGVGGEDGAAADAGEVLLVALHAAAPVALLLKEVGEAVFEVEGGVGFGEVVEGDLVDLVEGVALGPGDGGVAAEGEVDVGVDAFQVGFEGLQEGVELGAFDGGDPADDAVEFFVAFLGGEEEEEVHGGVYVFGVAGDAELEAAAGGFVDAAFDDFAVDGVVAGGEGEVHDADFKLAAGLFFEGAGVPGAGGHEYGALLGEEEDGFVAAKAGVAGLEVVGDFAEHFEPEGVGGVVEVEEAGFEGDEGFVVADKAVAVEVGAAIGAVGEGAEHHAVPVGEVVGGAGDGDVGLAGEGVGGGADLLADGEEFAVFAGGDVAAGELFEEVFVVEDAHAEEGEGHGHVFLHFSDVGGFHAVFVGAAQGGVGEVGSLVVRVGGVDVVGEGEEVAVVVGEPDVGGEH